MDDLVFAGNKALYLVLILSGCRRLSQRLSPPGRVFQTVTQLQEQTLPFGIKLLGVCLCLFLLSGWYGEVLLSYGVR
ncbi:virulence associated secretory protein [Salmonella enterica subsp. enterica]|uniref:Surface presentation of antigens protein SpaQ n=1 Tax=Salmonella enterica I TaxID=59201 RepID=A0A379WMM1_SALET|nr:virulence associated secretory protein [Salmonella enterica subsp. enterica]